MPLVSFLYHTMQFKWIIQLSTNDAIGNGTINILVDWSTKARQGLSTSEFFLENSKTTQFLSSWPDPVYKITK